MNQSNEQSHDELVSKLDDLSSRLDRLEESLRQIQQGPTPPPLPPAPEPLKPQTLPTAQEPIPLAPQSEPTPAEQLAAAISPPPLPSPSAAAPAYVPPAKPSPDRPTVEQRIGMKVLLIIGVAVMLLGGVFFFKFAMDRGWITPLRRTIMGGVMGLVMIALGEWAFRKKMRYFAAGLFGAGIVWWYKTVYTASPCGAFAELNILSTPAAFALMCCATVIGMVLAIRSNFRISALIPLVGAFLTPILLSTGQNRQVALMSYMLAINAGFLVLALWKRWREIPTLLVAGTVTLFALWFYQHFDSSAVISTSLFAWAFMAEWLVFILLAHEKAWQEINITILAVAAPAMALNWLCMGESLSIHSFPSQLLGLNVVILLLCLVRKWNWLRAALVVWTVAALGWYYDIWDHTGLGAKWLTTAYAWGMFLLISIDIFIRAYRDKEAFQEHFDAALASIAAAAMFLGTYLLLHDDYQPWMGTYTASLAVVFIAAAMLIRFHAVRRILAYSYIAAGLVLLVLAVPIQFDRATVTFAWAAQGAIAALVARRIRSRLVLAMAATTLLLAVCHFFGYELPHDPRMADVLWAPFGVDVTFALVMAGSLATALLLSAAFLSISWPEAPNMTHRAISVVATCAAVLVFCSLALLELPTDASTWWCLVFIAGICAVGLWRRSAWLTTLGGGLLIALAAKWICYDTFVRSEMAGPQIAEWVAANWQFGAGVALAVVSLLYARLLRLRRLHTGSPPKPASVEFSTVFVLLAAILIGWGGSFEVDRFFDTAHAGVFADPQLAEHMGMSLWWAVFASAVLAIGFACSKASLRYLAICVFALTLAKVFIVDMKDVKEVYRILSFVGLGGKCTAFCRSSGWARGCWRRRCCITVSSAHRRAKSPRLRCRTLTRHEDKSIIPCLIACRAGRKGPPGRISPDAAPKKIEVPALRAVTPPRYRHGRGFAKRLPPRRSALGGHRSADRHAELRLDIPSTG